MSSLRSTGWRQQCSGAPTYTCCRARISASTSHRGSAFGARAEGSGKSTLLECVDNPAAQPRSSPARSAPRRLFRVIDAAARDPLHRRSRQHRSTGTAAPTCSPSSTAATGGRRPTSCGLSRRLTGAGCAVQFNTFTGIAFAGLKLSPRPCRAAPSGSRSIRRPGKRSRSTWSTATAPSSSSAGASSPAGPPTSRSCRP